MALILFPSVNQVQVPLEGCMVSSHYQLKGREYLPLNSQCHGDATPVTSLDRLTCGHQLLSRPSFFHLSLFTLHSQYLGFCYSLKARATREDKVLLCSSLYSSLLSLGHSLKLLSFPEARFIWLISVCNYIVNAPLENISEAGWAF